MSLKDPFKESRIERRTKNINASKCKRNNRTDMPSSLGGAGSPSDRL